MSKRNILMELYSTPVRYYHTFHHAENVAAWAVYFAIKHNRMADIDALYTAGLWHDAVYVPGNTDNEKLSARALEISYPDHPQLTDAFNLICNTKISDHLSDDITWDLDAQLCCLLDADLVSLAAPYELFYEYQIQISKEYGFADLANDQIKFLQKFLEKKRIFRTPDSDHLERAARNNIITLSKHSL